MSCYSVTFFNFIYMILFLKIELNQDHTESYYLVLFFFPSKADLKTDTKTDLIKPRVELWYPKILPVAYTSFFLFMTVQV